MKESIYEVVFTTGQVEIVYAMCKKEATILAQVKQIKKGNRYEVEDIKKIN